ncbi:MAG: peroxidase family protein [Caldilineaceae bacterium]
MQKRSPRSGLRPLRRILVLLAGIALFIFWLRRQPPGSVRDRLLAVSEWFNLRVDWWKLPPLLALLNFEPMRSTLRRRNLHDTQALPSADAESLPESAARWRSVRSPDGTYNDLAVPAMGSARTRFGRNVPLEAVAFDESRLLTPNPRTVSQQLLTRHSFQPATILNLLAAAWLQFQLHDWLSHGPNDSKRFIEVPLAADDPWFQHPMLVPRTSADPTRTAEDAGRPPTFVNIASQWWDGSQLYGSSQLEQERLRAFEGGRLALTESGLLPLDTDGRTELTGVTGNWWLGLSLMHTLFAREHNAICAMLAQAYPRWSDDLLFDHARLINVALMAKIHTVEWTPGILATPVLRKAMRSNWWGALDEQFRRRYGRLGSNDILSGITGSLTDHHGALYALTEEFTSVYRMHPLIPDDYALRSHRDDAPLRQCTFRDVSFSQARRQIDTFGLPDLLYSFGTMHPGAITLHNYPRFLQTLQKEDSEFLTDMGSVDILRDRERGVPRYNQFRRLLHKRPVTSFEELTPNPVWAAELREVYDGKIEDVDVMVGLYGEAPPPGFGFSDTAFRIFILMASRRLKSDRFFTTDYTATVYTPEGMRWIDDNTMSTVLLRHCPELQPYLAKVENAFAPWPHAPGR